MGSQQSDHLVEQLLGHAVGVVMLEEGGEVEFVRDFLAGLSDQAGAGVLCHHHRTSLQTLQPSLTQLLTARPTAATHTGLHVTCLTSMAACCVPAGASRQAR